MRAAGSCEVASQNDATYLLVTTSFVSRATIGDYWGTWRQYLILFPPHRGQGAIIVGRIIA